MAFAEPDTCPDCRSRLSGATRCPRCGLDLTTPAAQNVLAALRSADGWLAHARAESIRPPAVDPAPAPGAAAAGAGPTTRGLPSAPPVAVTGRSGSKVSAGAVVLALGALCLLVAGTIFLTVAWGSLGVAGRALVLLAFTAVVAGAAALVTRRGLRGSAEALWGVALGLLTLDWFAARDQGLLGLDELPAAPWVVAWSVVVVAAALAVVRLGRRAPLGRELVVPSVAAGLAPWAAALAVGGEVAEAVDGDRAFFWSVAAAAAVLAVAAVVAALAHLRQGLWVAGAGLAAALLATVSAAVAEAVENPSVTQLAREAHGLPLVLVALAAGAVALVGRLPGPVRLGAAVVAAGAVVVLVLVPAEEAATGIGGRVAATVLLLLLAVPTGRDVVVLGVRAAGAVLAAGTALVSLEWLGVLAAGLGSATDGAGEDPLGARIALDLPTPPAWLPALVAAGLVVWLLGAARRETDDLRSIATVAAAVTAATGLVLTVVVLRPPVVVLALLPLVAALVVLVAVRPARPWWDAAAGGLVAAGALLALDSWWACALVWPAAAALLGVVASRHRDPVAAAAAAGSAALATAAPAAVLLGADAGPRLVSVATAAAAALVLLVVQRVLRAPERRLGVEAGAAVVGLVAVGHAAGATSTAWTALVLTVLGGGATAVALLVRDRRWYRWPATALLGAAWVLRLAASDVEVVEAYTAPFAVVLLALGAWALRDADGPGSTPALGPGLTLALLPSLPQALDDPTSLRALLLGLVAAVALAVGVLRRLRAPLVGGAAVLALVVLANVGPYAVAVPRWVVIAAAGVVLLGVGVTWEDRVRDGRAAVRRIATMR